MPALTRSSARSGRRMRRSVLCMIGHVENWCPDLFIIGGREARRTVVAAGVAFTAFPMLQQLDEERASPTPVVKSILRCACMVFIFAIFSPTAVRQAIRVQADPDEAPYKRGYEPTSHFAQATTCHTLMPEVPSQPDAAILPRRHPTERHHDGSSRLVPVRRFIPASASRIM